MMIGNLGIIGIRYLSMNMRMKTTLMKTMRVSLTGRITLTMTRDVPGLR